MASTFIKAPKVVSTTLGLLLREMSLPGLVWRDAGGDFAGAAGDTVTIRLPSYATARTRVLRAGTAITMDDLAENVITVTLNTDVYKAVPITDEQLTLDIVNFGQQVLDPVVRSVGMGFDDAVAALMVNATYNTTLEIPNTETLGKDVYDTLIDARKALNNANVPQEGRSLVVGSNIEARLLKSPSLVKVNESGSDSTLRDALIGRIAGFNAIISNSIPPNLAFAFHRSAYVMSTRAPLVPDGASWGATQSYGGIAMRVLRDYDFVNTRDRLLADAYLGTNIVTDIGGFDANGKFVATDQPYTPLAITSVASTDIFTNTGNNNFAAGDKVTFTGLTGGAGLVPGTTYYVIATNLTATTFMVSATPGGATFDHTTNVTAGSVAKGGNPLFVRAVKITDLT